MPIILLSFAEVTQYCGLGSDWWLIIREYSLVPFVLWMSLNAAQAC